MIARLYRVTSQWCCALVDWRFDVYGDMAAWSAYCRVAANQFRVQQLVCACHKERQATLRDAEPQCLAPYILPVIFVFSNKVFGTGGFIYKAWWGLIWADYKTETPSPHVCFPEKTSNSTLCNANWVVTLLCLNYAVVLCLKHTQGRCKWYHGFFFQCDAVISILGSTWMWNRFNCCTLVRFKFKSRPRAYRTRRFYKEFWYSV